MPNEKLLEEYKRLLELKKSYDQILMDSKKPIKLSQCRVCFKELKEKQRQYCSLNCKSQYRQIKIKFEQLKKDNPNLNLVIWKKDDNPNGKLEWRNIKGIEHKPYKTIKNIITRKKGKPINKDLI